MLKSNIRFVYMIALGIACTLLNNYVLQKIPENSTILRPLGFNIMSSIIVWEGNLLWIKWLNKQYPWEKNTRIRIVYQLIILTSYSLISWALLSYSHHWIMNDPPPLHDLRTLKEYSLTSPNPSKKVYTPPDEDFRDHVKPIDPLILEGSLMFFLLMLIDISNQLLIIDKKTKKETERYREESIQSELKILKSQINPHFLFNNQSVLNSLIYQNREDAHLFVINLSKVYRHILENKDVELIRLADELDFINNYVDLLRIRFDKGIQFQIEVKESDKSLLLPPFCLQLLIENTFQHNEISIDNPLIVDIYTDNNRIFIENSIQPRKDRSESFKTGLENIKSRYAFFTDQRVEILNNGKVFSVSLPLLKL